VYLNIALFYMEKIRPNSHRQEEALILVLTINITCMHVTPPTPWEVGCQLDDNTGGSNSIRPQRGGKLSGQLGFRFLCVFLSGRHGRALGQLGREA